MYGDEGTFYEQNGLVNLQKITENECPICGGQEEYFVDEEQCLKARACRHCNFVQVL